MGWIMDGLDETMETLIPVTAVTNTEELNQDTLVTKAVLIDQTDAGLTVETDSEFALKPVMTETIIMVMDAVLIV